jgi:hypothetical protein
LGYFKRTLVCVFQWSLAQLPHGDTASRGQVEALVEEAAETSGNLLLVLCALAGTLETVVKFSIKWSVWGVAQEVEYLPSQHRAPSSNPSI